MSIDWGRRLAYRETLALTRKGKNVNSKRDQVVVHVNYMERNAVFRNL